MACQGMISRFQGGPKLCQPERETEESSLERNLSFRRALVATMTLLAACRDSTSPAPPVITFDAAHARARVEPLAKIFDLPIFTSFQGALSYIEPDFRSGGSIPDSVRGKTFIYDVGSHSYVLDPPAGGVPAGEVRFVLYAWESGSGQPSTPLARVGYVDLAAVNSEATGPRLTEVIVVREGPRLVAADFIVMHNVVNGAQLFGIEGSATDGFTVGLVELDGTESGAPGQHDLVYNVSFSNSPTDLSVAEELIFDQPTASQSGSLALSYDGHTFSDASVANGAELRYDGSLYARALFPTNPQEQTQYLRPDGSSLTAEEITNVNALLLRVVAANFFWVNLAWP